MAKKPKKTKTRNKPWIEPDVYVTLLFVTTAVLCVGIMFLAIELDRYGWQTAP